MGWLSEDQDCVADFSSWRLHEHVTGILIYFDIMVQFLYLGISNLRSKIFQQDGVSPVLLSSLFVRLKSLDDTFPDGWIRLDGSVLWFSHSPDIKLLDVS